MLAVTSNATSHLMSPLANAVSVITGQKIEVPTGRGGLGSLARTWADAQNLVVSTWVWDALLPPARVVKGWGVGESKMENGIGFAPGQVQGTQTRKLRKLAGDRWCDAILGDPQTQIFQVRD